MHVTLYFAPKENNPAVQGQAVVQGTQCRAPVRQACSETILAVNCELPHSYQVAPFLKEPYSANDTLTLESNQLYKA